MPRLYLMPGDQPNAFASGRDPQHAVIATTEGLLRNLSLEQIRGVHPSTIRRRAEDILDVIVRGRSAPPIPREEVRGRFEAGDAPLIALAEALLRARSLDAGLAYELIASRSELEQIVAAARRGEPPPSVRTLTGWRRELVGEDLRGLLAGEKAVAVGPGRRLELTTSPPRASS